MSQRYTVTWSPKLENDYTKRWIAADGQERARLTRIANCIDHELKFSPERHGFQFEGRPGAYLWRLPEIDPPVLAMYEVSTDDRVVRVRHLLYYREE